MLQLRERKRVKDRKGRVMGKICEFCFGLEESVVMINNRVNISSNKLETRCCLKFSL